MKTTWDFVEKYYPNYESSSEITENDDLHKIINGELNGEAETIYNEMKEEIDSYNGGGLNDDELHNEIIKAVEDLKAKSDASIFHEAIKNYLLTIQI